MEYFFGGKSSNIGNNFILQKKIRIMAGPQPRTSRRSLFKQLEFLAVPYQYILINELHYL